MTSELAIVCNCPDKYFASLGIPRDVLFTSGNFYALPTCYDISPNVDDNAKVVLAMLKSQTTFTAKNLDVEELKKHVATRLRIVANVAQQIPQYNQQSCYLAAQWAYGAANAHGVYRSIADGVWILGDWGYVASAASVAGNPADWKDEGLLFGENVIEVGGT